MLQRNIPLFVDVPCGELFPSTSGLAWMRVNGGFLLYFSGSISMVEVMVLMLLCVGEGGAVGLFYIMSAVLS